MVTMIIVTIGSFALLRLPIDLLPDISLPTLTVRAEYEDASPEEMERLVTEYIEATVSLVSGVEEISSETGEGVTNVRVRFVWGTDLDAASNDVRDRIDRVADELPDDISRPELRKYDISNSPIVLLGLSSGLEPVELTRLVEDQILYRIERLPGVASVDIWGEFNREIRVEMNLAKIKALDLSPSLVIDALQRSNVNRPAGTLEQGRYEITIRTPGEFLDLDEIRNTVVAVRERGEIRISDIASVVDTHEEITRIVRINGERGVRLAIRKQSDANTADVAKRVLEAVDRINAEMPQVNVVPVINQGQYIERAISNVGRSILYGGGLSILVLLVFLRNLRSTMVIAAAIPISIISTFALIFFSGFSLNLMTLGGLALGVGMMVDNSIVVLENIFRRREEEGEGKKEGAVLGAGEVASAITASTVTTLVIFLPLGFIEGVSGVLFTQLAMVVAFSLIISLLVALTVVPMMASRLLVLNGESEHPSLGRRMIDRIGGVFDAIERVYQDLLRDVLRARILTILLAVAALGGSLMLVPHIGTEFLPPSDEGEIRISGNMEVGTRLDIVDRQTRMMERIVYPAVPEMVSAVVSVGASSWNPDDAAEGDIRMSLVPVAERQRSNVEIADDLRERLEGRIPGMEIRVRAPQGQRLLSRLVGGDEELDIEIRGHDLAVLDALAKEAGEAVADVPGITDVRISREAGIPQQLVRIDRDRAADLGVSVERIAESLETTLGGTRAGQYRTGGNEHRILVQMANAKSIPLEEILDITVRSDSGEEVALRNVVRTESGRGPLVIDRKDQQRITTVSANISGRDLGSVAADISERLRDVPRPVGYEFIIAGSYEEQQKAFRELLLTFALAVILVYMVLASQYESLRDPIIVMLSVPTAAIGVLIILFLTNTTLNIQSYIGCIMLGGIVVNNAILLVDQAGRLRRERGMETNNALIEAGRRRLRPILMTTLTTILGLLPLAMGIGEGADAQAPLARAVVGGLAFSMLVTLVLVPAVYSLVHPDRRQEAAV